MGVGANNSQLFKGLTVCSYCWRIRKWWILIFIVSSLATWLNFLIGWLLLTPTLVLSPKSCQMKVRRGSADICSCVSTDMLFQRQRLGHRLSPGLTLLPRLPASPSVKAGFLFMQWSRCRSGDSLPWLRQHCVLQKSLEILHMWTLSPGFRIYRCRFWNLFYIPFIILVGFERQGVLKRWAPFLPSTRIFKVSLFIGYPVHLII